MNTDDRRILEDAVKEIMDKETKSITYNNGNGEIKKLAVIDSYGYTSGGWLQVCGVSWSDIMPLKNIDKVEYTVDDNSAQLILTDWLTAPEVIKYIIKVEFK